jgi:transposase
MSTNVLCQMFKIWGYTVIRMAYDKEAMRFVLTISQSPGALRCPACHSRCVIRRGTNSRRFRGVPVGSTPVDVVLEVVRVECLDCGVVRQARVKFAEERKSYTREFERLALELCKSMTIQDVARFLGVSWDLIKDIQKRSLHRRFRRIKLKHLRYIAIDEICIGRGHRYLTVVLDLSSGAVVFVGNGKGADALEPFWKRLRGSHAKIQAVAMDMAPAYIGAVHQHLRKAAIVFDHFHVIKLFNEKLSDLRRELYREAKDLQQKRVLKGTRWLLLKNPDNLSEDGEEEKRLREALRLNEPLAIAYYLKEDLRQVWEQYDKDEAEAILDDWISRAEVSGVRILVKFAHTLAAHRTGILAFYDHNAISTGPLEGTNTKIRVLQHNSYGFRDMEFFKLKIYALHEAKLQLVG